MPSRYFDFRLALGIPLLLMVCMLVIDPRPVDFALANLFYQPGEGFIGRHSFWLEDILHDRAKQAVIVLGVLAIAGFVLSLLPTRLRTWRRQLGYLVLALGL
ncbi:MAG: phosphoesterase, partial [Pseudomonas sp.]|nr:phosphoesterase [Pseudomonas sp.]